MKLFFCVSWHNYPFLSQQNTFMASTVILSKDISKLFKTSFVIHPLQFNNEKKLRGCDHALKYFELFLCSLLYSFYTVFCQLGAKRNSKCFAVLHSLLLQSYPCRHFLYILWKCGLAISVHFTPLTLVLHFCYHGRRPHGFSSCFQGFQQIRNHVDY